MHRLASSTATRYSVSSLFLHHGSLRVAAASPSSNTLNTGEIVDDRAKWYSVLSSRPNTATVNCGHAPFQAFRRHDSTAAEKFEYQAEVSRLMDLIVNSLYSDKKVFLRELISNASDALNKLKFLGVTEPGLLKDDGELDIFIQTDKDNGIVTITDSGIGMTRQELVDCLGTIAQSGAAKFLKDSKDAGADSNLIRQFGVGFYSCFFVSERVEVSTKSPKSDKQYVWEGEANSRSYTIREETDSAKLIPRGTHVTLYLKHDDKSFAHPEIIQNLVEDYSHFVTFPIYTMQEEGYMEEVEVDDDLVEDQVDKPDGNNEHQKKKTKTVVERYWDWGLTNESKPIRLRNSKEVTTEEYNEFYKKTFNECLEPLSSSHFTSEDYDKFFENFGKNTKLGCIEDRENHKCLAQVFRIFSSQSEDELISLDEYVANMKPEQKDIYYIAHDSFNSSKKLPFLQKFEEDDIEVLFLVDPIDEIAIQNLKSYKEKNFVDISKEDLDLA